MSKLGSNNKKVNSLFTFAFASDMINEYEKARTKFGAFNNGHEGLAVIWEEFEELKAFVFGKNQTLDEMVNAKKECIQIAAMAMAFSLELLEGVPENER